MRRDARDSHEKPVHNFQTATQHQQPMMNPTLPPGYAYAFTYSSGIMPGGFQYGTPAIYPVCLAHYVHEPL